MRAIRCDCASSSASLRSASARQRAAGVVACGKIGPGRRRGSRAGHELQPLGGKLRCSQERGGLE